MTRQRQVLDNSVLVDIVDSSSQHHRACYSFARNLHDADEVTWVVPGLVFFEYQATRSRLAREQRRNSAYRDLRIFTTENTELHHVTSEFLANVYNAKLYDLFSQLRGADLLYACIAKIEGIPLVTHDGDFDRYAEHLQLIKPKLL